MEIFQLLEKYRIACQNCTCQEKFEQKLFSATSYSALFSIESEQVECRYYNEKEIGWL